MANYNRAELCVNLRSKNMYTDVDSEPDRVRGDSTDMTEIFWCIRTMQAFGPDDRLCDADTCRPGRECFKGLLD